MHKRELIQPGEFAENQHVLFNNAGTGAFDNPTGQTVANGSQILLLDGSDYTLLMSVFYDGANVTVAQDVYQGIGTGGSNPYSASGAAPGSFAYTTFDGLAFGYRGASSTGALSPNVSALDVRLIPEPSTLALLGLGGLLALLRRRS